MQTGDKVKQVGTEHVGTVVRVSAGEVTVVWATGGYGRLREERFEKVED